MKKIKIYISIIALVLMTLVIIIKPQYIEQAVKGLIAIMECEICLSE